ncbi:hypothetical protein M5L40_003589 [Clostridium botulinum]|nr:hypothetical protein [Clostridium botulinum]
MKTKQQKIIEMIKNFQELSSEDQIYVGGIVQGMFLQKQNSGQLSEAHG